MLTAEVALALSVDAGEMDSALAIGEAHDLRNCIFRRNREQHVHVVRHQMPFFDPAVLVPGQVVKHLAEVLPKPVAQGAAAILRRENNELFGLPLGVT